nr:ATP-binding cassette transporter Abcc1-6 [Brachionus angularis]
MSTAFEQLCGSKFWDPKTVYSDFPDLSACFQSTVLVWVPCLLICVLSPTWVYMVHRKRNVKTKFTWLSYTKFSVAMFFVYFEIIISLLILIEITTIILAIVKYANKKNVYPVNFMTPGFLIVSYIKNGLRSSVLLFCFWGSLLLTSSFTFRSKIHNYQIDSSKIDYWDFVLFFEFYALLLIIFILTLFSEKKIEQKNEPELKEYPENNASLLSRITFWWINPLILLGYKREFSKEDDPKTVYSDFPDLSACFQSTVLVWVPCLLICVLSPTWVYMVHRKRNVKTKFTWLSYTKFMWPIDEKESCDYLTNKLVEEWDKVSKIYMEKRRLEFDNLAYVNSQETVTMKRSQDETKFKSKIKEPSLLLCLVKMFSGKFLAGAFMKLIQDGLTFVGPIILDLLIKFTKEKNQNPIVGYFLTGLLFFCSVLQTFLIQHYFHRMFIVGARVRSSLMGLIYRKSLKLSSQSRKQATVGEMVNLMQVNTQSFVELTAYVNMIWSGPLQIIICIIMLWQYLGVSSLAGVATIILFIPLNGWLSNKSKVLQTNKLKAQDARIKLTNEILNGIKVLKLYGWEVSFKNILEKIREGELGILLKFGIYNTFITLSFGAASFMIATASFVVFVLVDKNNNLDASTAFVSLTLFNIMRFPLIMIPQVITSLIQANVSMTRIRTFLLREEIDTSQITHNNVQGQAVSFENVDLGWSENEKALEKLNFEIPKGELVAVVGTVGSGKSSLLSGLLGEMHKFQGNINVNGATAYVPQQAWIQNATLKNNILFGHSYDEEFYNKVLSSCALLTDLSILPAGDLTEIGEKGINLSGGQKQRISLARSVYTQCDIYALDDPLSAVDAHVGKHIFDNVIGPKGLLKEKANLDYLFKLTRIFATNSLSFLSECDRIIMLEKGIIKEMGTFKDLMKNNSYFSEFLGQYTQNQKKDEEEENSDDKNSKPISKEIKDESKSQNSKQTEKAGEKIIVKEKVETGEVKFKILLEYFKSCSILYSSIFIVFYILTNVAQSGTSLWLSDWSNNANNPKDDKYMRIGVYTAIGVSQYILMFVGDIAFLKMVLKSSRYLHSSMLYSILRSTMQFFESTPTGRIINRFSKDVEAVENMIPAAYRILMRCLAQVLITVIMISITTPWFLIPLVPITIIYIYAQRYYVAAMRQLRRLNSVSKSPIFSHFGETLTGVTIIRAYNAETRFINDMENKINENLLYYYPDTVSNRWLAIRLEFIGTLVTLFACLFAVIGRNSLTGGAAGLSISYSLNVSQFLNWLVRMSADFESNVTSVERIKEYTETPHEEPWEIESSKPPAVWPNEGKVEFKNYSVKYREELDFVLKDINCTIKPGEKIGIVGRTGAGKSSLTLGLFRILESNYGQIDIDGLNIKTIGLHDLRKKLTIIPQDPVLFSGSLRINLDPFEEYSNDRIWNALEHAHLKEFVQKLDKQLDFECSEGGENLSVGQRQLICLARALLRKTKILILDEATASIDHNTDDLIQQTIRTEFKDCTVLTIAHRLNTILDSNRIMVLDKGKIVEFDSPTTLLSNKNTLFYSMASSAGLI